MEEFNYFYSLVTDANRRYVKLEDHEYIKQFPLQTNNYFSILRPHMDFYRYENCFVQYCIYVANNNYFTLGMFTYFIDVRDIRKIETATQIIIDSCNIDIVREYFKIFSTTVISFHNSYYADNIYSLDGENIYINPYCKNKNVTKHIIDSYNYLVCYLSFSRTIIEKGDIEDYILYKCHIVNYFNSVYN
jgi:hypothetical protein